MQPVCTQSPWAIDRGSPKYDHVHGVTLRVPAARATPAGGSPASICRVSEEMISTPSAAAVAGRRRALVRRARQSRRNVVTGIEGTNPAGRRK